MELAWVFAVAVALGMDAFSCSLALGLIGIRNRMALRLALVVAVFHVFMPLIGLWAGQQLGTLFGDIAIGIGALILFLLGGKMIVEAFRKDPNQSCEPPNLKGWGIYALAGSVSLDALSVGFSLGTFVSNIIRATLIMGAVAGVMTAGGVLFGRRVGAWLGSKAEALGGTILVLIGIKMLSGLF
ncbi:MAG: manganese efflux pump [Peptococcaceae bacterium]|nr:manganese efflux pump [Peptococcaceae bacterium]